MHVLPEQPRPVQPIFWFLWMAMIVFRQVICLPFWRQYPQARQICTGFTRAGVHYAWLNAFSAAFRKLAGIPFDERALWNFDNRPGTISGNPQGSVMELDMQEMTYGWPTEMIVKAAKRKAHILEIPVSYRSRRSGKSKVSGTVRGTLLAAWFILTVTLRHAWKF